MKDYHEDGEREKYWYRLSGLTTIILFLLGVMIFLAVLPLMVI